MKNVKSLLLMTIPLILTSCSNVKYEPKPLDPNVTYDNVYLIMGQSNATGVAPNYKLDETSPDVYQKYGVGNSKVLISFDVDSRIEEDFVPTRLGFGHNDDFFGPEIGIAEVLDKKEETSYIIKGTLSGSCLQDQYVTDSGRKLSLYNRFVKFIRKQVSSLQTQGKNPRIRGVFWMQGESDSYRNDSGTYRRAEQYFLEYLRAELNDWIYDHFNFVDAYIRTNGTWPKPEIINSCKQTVCDNNEHCYCIKTNGEDEYAILLNVKPDDEAHYDAPSMLLLGKTAGEYLIK